MADRIQRMDLDAIVRAVQQQLGVVVDGRAGPQTWLAIYQALVADGAGDTARASVAIGRANVRSEKAIATLLPEVQAYARALFTRARGHGITMNIISGLRTDVEQDALYAKGRTRPGARVTNARGGQSAHNFGTAFDVGLFDGNRYVSTPSKYKAVGVLGVGLGLTWGGNWRSLKDQSHFELLPAWAVGMPTRQMLAELRRRRNADIGAYT